MDKYLILSWQDFEERMCLLAQKVRENGFLPEILFTPLWNGAIIAKHLGYFLNVSQLEGVYISYYSGINEKKKQADISVLSSVSRLKGKKVLLVDDISDSGNTLKEAVKILRKYEAESYMTATLFVKPHTEFLPDVYLEKTERWIVFPWEYPELLRNFTTKKFGALTPTTLTEAKKLLKLQSTIKSPCLK